MYKGMDMKKGEGGRQKWSLSRYIIGGGAGDNNKEDLPSSFRTFRTCRFLSLFLAVYSFTPTFFSPPPPLDTQHVTK